jgi:hypothetical protein
MFLLKYLLYQYQRTATQMSNKVTTYSNSNVEQGYNVQQLKCRTKFHRTAVQMSDKVTTYSNSNVEQSYK